MSAKEVFTQYHSCDSRSRNIYLPPTSKRLLSTSLPFFLNKIPNPSTCTVPTEHIGSYSIMEGSLVSKIWSVRIQGMDISMGNWMRRPMVSSKKNSRNQSWDRSQHCCRASGMERRSMLPPHYSPGEGSEGTAQEAAAAASLLGMEHFSRMSLVLNPDHVHAA